MAETDERLQGAGFGGEGLEQAETTKVAVVGGDGVAVEAKMRLGAEQRYGYGLPFAVSLG